MIGTFKFNLTHLNTGLYDNINWTMRTNSLIYETT